MKHNLEHFSELMETQLTEEVKEIGKQSDILYGRLTTNLSEDVSSPKIQSIVHELLRLIQENSTSVSLDKPYINVLIDTYSSNYIKNMTDNKYKEGASDYIVKAFHYYSRITLPKTIRGNRLSLKKYIPTTNHSRYAEK